MSFILLLCVISHCNTYLNHSNISLYCHSFHLYSFQSQDKMSERKAVIKNADMSEEMQQDAVDCATQALEKYNIEKDIAAYIKKEYPENVQKAVFKPEAERTPGEQLLAAHPTLPDVLAESRERDPRGILGSDWREAVERTLGP